MADPNETVIGCIVGAENKANINNLKDKINENHQTMMDTQHEILGEVKGLKHFLFEGNGAPSLHTRVDRNSRWIKGVIVGSIPIYLGMIGLIFKIIWNKISGK